MSRITVQCRVKPCDIAQYRTTERVTYQGMYILLKNAHIVDPQAGLNDVGDVLIQDEHIAEVAEEISASDLTGKEGVDVVDLTGMVLVPGLVDLHVHLRDPGLEYKEDIVTGTRAAAAGGFTAVCAMPNTDPVCDNTSVIDYIVDKARTKASCRVYPAGACTEGLQGQKMTDMDALLRHGAVAFSDDGKGIQSALLMERVMERAAALDRTVMPHCQIESLVGKGQVNEGAVSARLGLAGWPAEGEEAEIERDIALCRKTGCPLHIQHISTARGLDMVRTAKAEGLPVTCEVTPHHLFLRDEDITSRADTHLKVNPPLRTHDDAQALLGGVVDGTVDAWVTDHAPHAREEKARAFEQAPFGMTGIETSLGLAVTRLVKPGIISWSRLVELMAINPRRILRLEPISVTAGSKADLTIIDPEATWEVRADAFQSKAQNSGFIGWQLSGRAHDVLVGGRFTLKAGALVDEEGDR